MRIRARVYVCLVCDGLASALAPAGWDVSPCRLVTVNMNLSSQAWCCDRSAHSPAPSRLCSQHAFIPAPATSLNLALISGQKPTYPWHQAMIPRQLHRKLRCQVNTITHRGQASGLFSATRPVSTIYSLHFSICKESVCITV